MEQKRVTVLAHIQAKPGKEDATKQALLAVVEASRRDAGCMNFDLHQLPGDPSRFITYENWARRADFEAHRASAHIAAFRERAGELLASPPDIQIWEMVSAPAK